MTSVRNHLRRLSGNKQLILFCLLFLAFACKAKRVESGQAIVVTPAEKTGKAALDSPLIQSQAKVLKIELWLALSEPEINDAELFNRMQALEGFLLGFDSLQRKGLTASVKVVNKSEIATGPAENADANLVIEQEKDVYRIYLKTENRWLESRPPMEMHTAALLRQAKKEGAAISVLTRGTELEKRVLEALTAQQTGVKVLEKNRPGRSEIKKLLLRGKKNIVYLPSPDETFVSYCLKELVELSAEYDIVVFGLPNWVDFPTIDPELLAKIPIRITTAQMVAFNDRDVKVVQQLFREKFSAEPQLAAFVAFDHCLFLGEIWLEHQKLRLSHFKENSRQLAQDFEFVPSEEAYVNKAVRILEYSEYQFKPIP